MVSPGTKKKVLVTILDQGWIRPELGVIAGMMQRDQRYDVTVQSCGLKPSERNRNVATLKMLQEGYDYLLTIDHDVVPLCNPLDLVELDLDVVCLAVPQWNMTDPKFPIYFVAMDKAPGGYTEHKKKEGLQEIDAAGSGCLLIARRVLEKVKAPFMRQWDENGIDTLGLDFSFSEKAKAQGFKVWCHYDFVANHFKEIGLLDVLNFKFS